MRRLTTVRARIAVGLSGMPCGSVLAILGPSSTRLERMQ